MQKFNVVLVPAFVLALALSAWAQAKPQPAPQGQERPLTTNKEMSDTVKVTVTGQVVLDYVWRSAEITAFTDPLAGDSDEDTSDDENTFEGFLAVRLDIEMADKVSAVVEFGTKRVDAGGIERWADGEAEEIRLREAHVMLGEFIVPNLKAQFGMTTWSFDVRGRGSSFAFDPRHSSSFAKNRNNVEDVDTALQGRAGVPDELETVGFWLAYSAGGLAVDFIFLPAVLEGGSPSDDESLYAFNFFYNLDSLGKGSRIGGILALVGLGDGPAGSDLFGTGTGIFTIGGGVTLKEMVPGLELYGEIYLQFGEAGKFDPPGVIDEDLDAQGMAFQVGAEYRLPNNPMNLWIAGNITIITGDDDDAVTSADDDGVDSFMSYENVNDLLILEDMYFGFDWDTNYTAFKISGGVTLSFGQGKDNLQVSAILGIARTTEKVDFGAVGGNETALGNEFDARAKWILSKQAALTAAVGLLFGSKVMEESMSPTSDHQDDGAILYTLGAELRF